MTTCRPVLWSVQKHVAAATGGEGAAAAVNVLVQQVVCRGSPQQLGHCCCSHLKREDRAARLPYNTAWVLEAPYSSLLGVPASQSSPQEQAQPQLGVQLAECFNALQGQAAAEPPPSSGC